MSGANFADIEQRWVQDRIYADFTWRASDDFSPVNRLAVPLTSARVAFVTTSGAHLAEDEPFDIKSPKGDPSFRAFPSSSSFADLRLTHRGYDTKRASIDMNAVLPLDHLRAAESAGRFRELAPTIYSFMGYVADPAPLVEETAPAVAERLKQDGADLVLLAPT